MLVNWAHYIIPKCSFAISFILNPLFIYLLHSSKLFGPYRYLLSFFAIFNMLASVGDLLVPVCVFNHRYAFITFITDGPFSHAKSDYGTWALSFRCAFIGGTHAVLNIHFIFRFLVLRRSHLTTYYFMPYGLILSIIYVITQYFIWAQIDRNFLYPTKEVKDYIRESFLERYHEHIDEINFVSALYSETSSRIICRSWIGIILLTSIASYSMILYFVLGYKIITGINTNKTTMSQRTAELQKQLFKALTIQTVIPICVSFMPCTLSFYGAALKIVLFDWVYWGAAAAVSMFSFLDPLAIIFFLPALRNRLQIGFRKARVRQTSTTSLAMEERRIVSTY